MQIFAQIAIYKCRKIFMYFKLWTSYHIKMFISFPFLLFSFFCSNFNFALPFSDLTRTSRQDFYNTRTVVYSIIIKVILTRQWRRCSTIFSFNLVRVHELEFECELELGCGRRLSNECERTVGVRLESGVSVLFTVYGELKRSLVS